MLHATAEALFAELGGTLSAQASLREIHMGEWEGELYDAIEIAHPQRSARFWAGDPHVGAPGGETPAQVAQRVQQFTREHWPAAGQTLILVSHGVAISALLTELLALDYQQAWASREIMHRNTVFTVLEVDPHTRQVHAAQISQTPHLS